MWKKDEDQAGTTNTGPTMATPPRTPGASDPSRRAVIGPSISIKGDVTGSEDLLIEGVVDGSVSLGKHAVGVGPEGRVQAAIVGRVITVEGQVEGNLEAQEQIVLRGTANVLGDIKAPRVVLEDGATFRGLVDMGAPARSGSNGTGARADADSKAPEAAATGDTSNGDADRAKSQPESATESKSSKPSSPGTSKATTRAAK